MAYQTTNSPSAVPQAPGDAFAVLNDCKAFYLKELGKLLVAAEPLSAKAVATFQASVGSYFDEMTASNRRSGFEEARGLTASRISLVKENDLELEIRLTDFSARLMEKTGGDLWRVYLRFITLLGRPDLSTADNPVGPRGIALGLTGLFGEVNENHDKTLDQIDRLETFFAQNLGPLYARLNDYLSERKIGAAQPALITSPDAVPPPAGAVTNAPTAAALLQQRLLGPDGTLPVANSPTASLLSQAMFERLLARLDELEQSGRHAHLSGGASPVHSGSTDPSLETLIPGLFTAGKVKATTAHKALNSGELGIPTSSAEAATIDTLAQIFEVIFASPNLPEAVKAALSSLQIPTLKAAMLDAAFFNQEAHPARRLLDKMARAALGMDSETSPRNPICARIQAIASQVRKEFTNDVSVFTPYLNELDTLIADRDQTVAQAAERFQPLLYQLDRRKQAMLHCQQVIEKFLTRGAPDSVTAFLREHWQKVLLISWMEGGEQGSAWQENTAAIGDLLWSIQPKTDVDDRKRLAKILPAMLQKLNAGMARIGLPNETKTAFLDTCFALQTAAMRGVPPASAMANQDAVPALSESKPELGELASGDLVLKTVDRTDDATQSFRLRPPPVHPGHWLSFALADEKLCGRLCQVSPDSGMLLLANPDWNYAVAIHPGILDGMLKAGSARICSNDSLFNQAAEQALRRASKPEA